MGKVVAQHRAYGDIHNWPIIATEKYPLIDFCLHVRICSPIREKFAIFMYSLAPEEMRD